MGKLQNRVALITAAGSGMGRASAQLFAAEGAEVIVADIDRAAADETVTLIEKDGGKARAHTIDVSDVEALRAMFDMVEKEYGILHVLFNHAGTPGPPGLEATEAQVDRYLAINTKSAYFATSFGVPLLRKAAPHGAIIFTASAAGLIGSARSPLYSYAKGGLVLFAQAVAKLEAKNGIRANTICPGHVRTAMTPEFMREEDPEKLEALLEQVVAAVPMGREGRPDDVASVALFLACDDSKFVTGVAIAIDGGMRA